VRVLEGHTSWVRSVAWSHDGQYIMSGSRDNTVRVWEADVQVCSLCWHLVVHIWINIHIFVHEHLLCVNHIPTPLYPISVL
jgi:WD40 repeat protein